MGAEVKYGRSQKEKIVNGVEIKIDEHKGIERKRIGDG